MGITSIITLTALIGRCEKSFNDIKPDMSSVKKIRPLGFQWETADPFLFCVHHEDKFPQGNDSMGPAMSPKGARWEMILLLKMALECITVKLFPDFRGTRIEVLKRLRW